MQSMFLKTKVYLSKVQEEDRIANLYLQIEKSIIGSCFIQLYLISIVLLLLIIPNWM